jgi:ABC-type lipoprotein export system ATPase subunit
MLHPAIKVIIDAREAGATEMRMRKAIRTAASALVFSQIGLRPKLSPAQNVESILNDCTNSRQTTVLLCKQDAANLH